MGQKDRPIQWGGAGVTVRQCRTTWGLWLLLGVKPLGSSQQKRVVIWLPCRRVAVALIWGCSGGDKSKHRVQLGGLLAQDRWRVTTGLVTAVGIRGAQIWGAFWRQQCLLTGWIWVWEKAVKGKSKIFHLRTWKNDMATPWDGKGWGWSGRGEGGSHV